MGRRTSRAVGVSCLCWVTGCGGAPKASATQSRESPNTARIAAVADSAHADSLEALSYEGVDGRGIPHYATIDVSPADSEILRRAYGVEHPHHLYVSDSTEEGILKYDPILKRCLTCYVNSYRVGYVSVRRPAESWEQAERRVKASPPSAFSGHGVLSSNSTADLDPDVRQLAETMLANARAAGFHLRVVATYRSPLLEARLMAMGKGRTHTLTSNHSYGRALDIVVDDGNRGRSRTCSDWVAFRRWVTQYRTPQGESFRVLGHINLTWDWPHVELPSSQIGFGSIDEAIARGRACLAPASTIPCNFRPHLPGYLAHTLVH